MIIMIKILSFILIMIMTSPLFAYSLDSAIIALQSEGKVISAKSRYIDGRLVYVIRILTDDGRLKRYRIDAKTGDPYR